MDETRLDIRSRAKLHWTDFPALILFTSLVAIVLLQFLSRYVFNDSIAWTEEIARYLLIGVAYSGSVIALRKSEHVFLEVLYRRMSLPNVKPLAIMVDLIVFAFHAILTVFTINLALQADRQMISVKLPKNIVYWFVAVMLFLATVIALKHLLYRSQQSSQEILDTIAENAGGDSI